MEKDLIDFLNKNIEFDTDNEKLLEKPKIADHGDFAMPMFILSKEMKKSPVDIAKEMQEKLSANKPEFIEKIIATGPYLNFYLNKAQEAKEVIENIKSGIIFDINIDNPQKVLIEWPSPNSNKPLHLGHLRNMLMGKSLALILEKTKNKVIRINLNNDRGIAICKSMLMYEKYAENSSPENENKKEDFFVGDFYTLFEEKVKENPKLEEEAQEMLKKWEKGDEKVIALWNKLNSWTYLGHNKTYEKLGIFHDKAYYESQIYKEGKFIVNENLKKGIFEKDEKENIICDLTKEGYDKKVLLRSDGTSIYITQDIALAHEKIKDFGDCDKYVFIVGNEQAYHFKVLFEILKKLGFGDLNKFYHFAYGMISLPEGKMSSRKGNVIYCDELIDEVKEEAKRNLLSKELTKNLPEEELEKRAKVISIGALSFFILKYNPSSNFIFNPKKSLAFEGETGPYVQYTYSRIRSILRKADYDESNISINYEILTDKESSLVKILKEYSEIVKEAAEKYRPSAIANYLIKISQAFNEFYQNCPILKEKEDVKNSRLVLIDMTSRIIKDGLELLGIETLEEM